MIRKASKNDINQIFDIFSETKTPWSCDGVLKSIEKDEIFLLCEEEICAVIAISRVLDEAEILNFAVPSRLRRQGYGENLLKSVLEILKNEGICSVFLDVRESNESAIKLYKKVGFENAGIRKNFYRNPCENALLMALYIK